MPHVGAQNQIARATKQVETVLALKTAFLTRNVPAYVPKYKWKVFKMLYGMESTDDK